MFRAVLLIVLLFKALLVDAAVVANPSVPVSEVTRQYLLTVFSVRTHSWPDGQSIKVFVLPPKSDSHLQFVKKVLGIFPYQLKKSWDRALFSGAAQLPTVVNSPEEMLDQIRLNKGAVGYIPDDLKEVTDVKLLEVH